MVTLAFIQVTREGGARAEHQEGPGGRQECAGSVKLQRQLPVLLPLHGLWPQLPALPRQVSLAQTAGRLYNGSFYFQTLSCSRICHPRQQHEHAPAKVDWPRSQRKMMK